MGRIYLLRHGQTAWNKEEVFRGTLDVPLDDVGRRQARDAGRALKRKGLKDPVIYCSPQARDPGDGGNCGRRNPGPGTASGTGF